MSFKCKYCKHSGKIGLLGMDNGELLAFKWYRDKKNNDHTGIYCTKCGTIHDCLISFIKLPLSIFQIVHPYKIVSVLTYRSLITAVTETMGQYPINCQEAAIFVYSLNELLLEKMRKSKFLDECYDSPLTMDAYEFIYKFKYL